MMKQLFFKEIAITEENIDNLSLELQNTLKNANIDKNDLLRMRLTLEDALFCWLNTDNKLCSISLTKHFNKFVLTLTAQGTKFNPLQKEAEDISGAELTTYLQSITKHTGYEYHDNKNIVTFWSSTAGLSTFQQILLAIVFAVVSFLSVKIFIPDLAPALVNNIVAPAYNTLLGIFTAIVAPVIFFSLLVGIISMGNPRQLNTIGKDFLRNCLGMMVALYLFYSATLSLLLPLSDTTNANFPSLLASLSNLTLGFIPTNLLMPFITGNIMQIVILAMVFGSAILYMREEMDTVVDLIYAVHKLLSSILQVACSFIPLINYLGLMKILLDKGSQVILPALTLISYIFFILCLTFIALTLYLGITIGRNPLFILRHCKKSFFLAFSTSSSFIALDSVITMFKKNFVNNPRLINFAVPLGQTMNLAGSLAAIFVTSVICMHLLHLPLTCTTILLIGFICLLLVYGAPPVAGGDISVLTLLFTSWKFPKETLALAITAAVCLDCVYTLVNVYSNIVVNFVTNYKLGLIDEAKLDKG
jgi:Na+/H+-dicarboxylate symporter